jgi:hypothetical protein
MNDEEFMRLATLYLENAIDSQELVQLNAELANSALRVNQFNDLRMLAGLIAEHGNTEEIDDETSSAPKPAPDADKKRGPKLASLVVAMMIPILATAAVWILLWNPGVEHRDKQIPTFAQLTYTSNAVWKQRALGVGDEVGPAELHLSVGLARLDFHNGATITLQGPADFEILTKDHMRLNSGILTASIPESAIGFEVTTPAMEVVDLGTAFGVAVGIDGETDVCVFEGEVAVTHHDNAARSTHRLREGNAMRSSPQVDSFSPVDFDTNRYEEAWPVTSGVLQATGLMKFVAPGPSFVPGHYEDNDRVLVFLERADVVPKQEIPVDLVEPGMYQRIHRSGQETIKAGTALRSYLLQLDPIGRLARDAQHKPRVMGQVTFDAPVLGLIASSNKLSSTDDLLGHPKGNYVKTRRGIEPPRSTDKAGTPRDVVILSDDRRTLSVDLSAGTAIDQIRVIVSNETDNNSKL